MKITVKSSSVVNLDMDLISQLKASARKLDKKIVLPEGAEKRILKAAEIVLEENIARVVLLGDPALKIPSKIKTQADTATGAAHERQSHRGRGQ